MNRYLTSLALASGWLLVTGCASTKLEPETDSTDKHPPEASEVSFTESIRPILSNKCTICHNTEVLPKRPNFETREGAMRSGMIVPRKPEASRFLAVVKEEPTYEKAMPPVSHQLTQKEISLLSAWIAQGAQWPSGEEGRVKPAFIPQE